jgi:hypothetical protein
MPSKKKTPPPEIPSIQEEAGLPPNWQPVDVAPLDPNNPSSVGPPMPSGRDPFQTGALPSNFGLQTDLVRTGTPSNVPSVRLMPIAPSGLAQSNAAIKSVATTIVNEAITQIPPAVTIDLESNGVLNSSQTVLNLSNGQNTTVVAGAAGLVQTNVPVFQPSGASHSSGAVPDPGATAGTTRYLREDATFDIPPASQGVNKQTGSYLALSTDSGFLISFNITGASTLTLPATSGATWSITVENNGSALLTVDPNGLNLDYTANSIVLGPNQGIAIYSDGTNYFTNRGLGDGLIHGTTPSEIDPSYSFWRDDFLFGTAAQSAVGASTFGELRWDSTLGSGATILRGQGTYPNVGIEIISSGSTASTASAIFLPFAGDQGAHAFNQAAALPLLDYPGWKMIWVFGWPSSRTTATASNFPLTKKQFYCGLSTVCNYTSAEVWEPNNDVNARPPYFIGLRFDTDTTSPAISDSTFHFETVGNFNFGNTRNNTQGTAVDTGITPTEYTYYRFEMLCTAAGQIQMTLTGAGSTFTSTLSPSKVSTTGGVGSFSLTLTRGNGLGELNQASNATSGNNNFTMAVGSRVALSGATNSFYDGTVTLLFSPSVTGTYTFSLPGAPNTESSSPAVLTYYPGLVPYLGFGNDTQATPASVQLGVDFFSLVLSQGLAGVGQTPNNSRYY